MPWRGDIVQEKKLSSVQLQLTSRFPTLVPGEICHHHKVHWLFLMGLLSYPGLLPPFHFGKK